MASNIQIGNVLFLLCVLVIVAGSEQKKKRWCPVLANPLRRPPGPPGDRCRRRSPQCGICRCPIDVTIKVKNILTPPVLDKTVTVNEFRQQTLIRFMEKAFDVDDSFKFSASYGSYGYFIETISGLSGNTSEKTYWHISSAGNSLQCGVSSYVPEDNEIILFNFTTWGGDGEHE